MPLLIDVFACRTDNFGYLVHDVATGRTAAIDAPEFKPIKAALERRDWKLTDLFITHHHTDHVEAIPALKREYDITVTGPREEASKILGLDELVGHGDTVQLGETVFEIFATPGHTLGHIVYYDGAGRHLFAADALFSMGVGRMFEGKPAPMWEALAELRELPDDTLLYCGHEYTLDNANFALSVDPRNAALTVRAAEVKRMRASDQFTIPVTLGMEKATNPFLRVDKPAIVRAMGMQPDADPAAVFGALRKAKDDFKG
ncbi:hydroxyacylglutathione hydrolase [Devosia sp.]|uniref:hydroxyacylglutathione hydrolase n=1 Tax=Devosia sp. TaxID=1871048 RepID=UPI003A8CE63B